MCSCENVLSHRSIGQLKLIHKGALLQIHLCYIILIILPSCNNGAQLLYCELLIHIIHIGAYVVRLSNKIVDQITLCTH